MEETLRQFILSDMLKGRDVGELSSDRSLLQSGILDSVGLLRLLLFIEEQFEVSVEDEELVPENFDTIQSLARFVQAKQAAAPS